MNALFKSIFSCDFKTKTFNLSYLTIDFLSKEILCDELITKIKITMTPTTNAMVPAFGLIGLLRQSAIYLFGAINMNFSPTAFLRALLMSIFLMADLAWMMCFFIIRRTAEDDWGVVSHDLNIIVDKSAVYMNNLFFSNFFHGAFFSIANNTFRYF